MKILKYTKYSFLNDCLLESEFMNYQFGIEPMGTTGGGGNYAFSQDPRMSYNGQDSPYTDFYARQSGLVSNLVNISKNALLNSDIIKIHNPFLEDISLFRKIKILRLFENTNLKIDVYISFEYDEIEYFGVFKNFNGQSKPKLETELYYDPNYQYRFNIEYKTKLSNHFFKKLENWFIPDKGFYKNLKDNNIIKNPIGKLYEINNEQKIEILGYNKDSNNKPYIILKCKNETYHIDNNDYYFFKWRFDKLK